MDPIDFLANKYGDDNKARDAVIELYKSYREWDLQDSNFDTRIVIDDEQYASCLWEMLLAYHLRDIGFEPKSADEGPDFRVEHDGTVIWIEAVCPTPRGIPDDWFTSTVMAVPFDQILLRWTSAIKEKGEKLDGYLQKGIVGENDAYVIAVSSCLLGPGGCFLHQGISQFPFAVEAVFPVGPHEIVFDRISLEKIEQRRAHRPFIKKLNNSEVPTDIFLDPANSRISAVLGSPAGIGAACGDPTPIAVVHNPLAEHPVPLGALGADEDFYLEDNGEHYNLVTVGRNEGR